MKNRVTTLDIVTLILELREKLTGLRVDQLYDIDKKTYLIRLAKTGTKIVLLIESGARFHTTSFEWPKNAAPSGFTMKLRKHLNNKRLESINQVGADRVVDFQFGTGVVAVHLLLELYDKGNIILTDDSYNILSLVRPHIQGEDRLVAHEKYTIEKAKQTFSLTEEEMFQVIQENSGKSIREALLPKVEFGPALFSHTLKKVGLSLQTKIPMKEAEEQFREFGAKLFESLENGRKILEAPDLLERGGFIVTQQQSKPQQQSKSKHLSAKSAPVQTDSPNLIIYDQYQPMVLATDFPEPSIMKLPGLDEALDEFYSKLEAQKVDMKQLNQEKEAYRKLERVKEDQRNRLNELKLVQQMDKSKGELIMFNQEIIDQAIVIIRQLIANQISWDDIWQQIKEAQMKDDPIAKRITSIQLIKNQFKMLLQDPYQETSDEENEDHVEMGKQIRPDIEVEIDLNFSAYANATKFFDMKKSSAKKEERTLESQEKVFKSTEKKTLTTLREITTIQSIKKLRKIYWFEKFHWFISSENFIVLGGHDAQQNELLVKRYMSPYDVYLHADSHGAPTIIIKNHAKLESLPPKTLNEAGTLAVCASGSWETKIISTCWWVWGHQVSKSAPTGEYLPTGSFMIRGKKNYLPPCQLVLGFAFLFRLTDESIVNHKGERNPRDFNNEFSEKNEESKEMKEEIESKLEEEEKEIPSAESSSESLDDDNAMEDEFPDTEVQIQLGKDTSSENKGRLRTVSSVSSEYSAFSNSTAITTLTSESGDTENYVIVQSGVLPGFSADSTKLAKKKGEKGKKGNVNAGGKKPGKDLQGKGPSTQSVPSEQPLPQKQDNQDQAKPKRGQHGRQKKLKEKYKFQDEDEREMRMQLLQSKGKKQQQQPPPSSKGQQKTEPSKSERTGSVPVSTDSATPDKENVIEPKLPEQTPEELERPVKAKPKEEPEVDSQQQEEEQETTETETDYLDSLTGAPLEQDELLFAIPVIGPYSSLQNYKFRIKLIPGSTKRGKAAKTAIELFTRDKNTRQREKDLIKSVKDQDLARNFPGKVKLAGGAIDARKK